MLAKARNRWRSGNLISSRSNSILVIRSRPYFGQAHATQAQREPFADAGGWPTSPREVAGRPYTAMGQVLVSNLCLFQSPACRLISRPDFVRPHRYRVCHRCGWLRCRPGWSARGRRCRYQCPRRRYPRFQSHRDGSMVDLPFGSSFPHAQKANARKANRMHGAACGISQKQTPTTLPPAKTRHHRAETFTA